MNKASYCFSLLAGCLITGLCATAQSQSGIDSTGLPGDNFSLQGALELFKTAASLEDFEKALNSESNHVNNLDLDGDGNIDYIMVIDQVNNNTHAIVLQVAVSASESQDIAVIGIDKTNDDHAVLQILGDEDIYGEEVIVEPTDESMGMNNLDLLSDYGNNHGPAPAYVADRFGIVVNVWLWPSVRFIYAPAYTVWRSPWRWAHYPGWWSPWRPYAWQRYRPLRQPYYAHCNIVRTHRVGSIQGFYRPMRTSSVTVRTHNRVVVNNYRVNRSRTTISGPRGNRVTHQSTTVHGRNGQGGAKQTNTTIKRHR